MNLVFYISAIVAIIATFMVITRVYAMHALLYLIVSLLSVALMFYTLGAPFVAALEVIVYAGAIMVLFIFAIMLLNLGPRVTEEERQWFRSVPWIGPAVLSVILLVELVAIFFYHAPVSGGAVVEPNQVGIALFGPYLIGVELASLLLLSSMVGAYHLGQRFQTEGRQVEAAPSAVPEVSPGTALEASSGSQPGSVEAGK